MPSRTVASPTVYVIQGMTGRIEMWQNVMPLRTPVPELFAAVLADASTPPGLVVYVDAFTALGGSQYVNSPGTGDYLTYLCDDVIPYVDQHYRTIADREHRAITGKSSGGYGAMTGPMRRPDVFSALASHCGDALFEVCYQPEFAHVARALRDHYDGSYERFWHEFGARPAFTEPDDEALVNTWCMAACYSTDQDGTVRLPFDTATARLDDGVWQRWLANDPVRMAADHADALGSMRGIWLDSGDRDEYHLDLAAQAFADELDRLGVRYELQLHHAGHRAVEYRYPTALRWLLEVLAA